MVCSLQWTSLALVVLVAPALANHKPLLHLQTRQVRSIVQLACTQTVEEVVSWHTSQLVIVGGTSWWLVIDATARRTRNLNHLVGSCGIELTYNSPVSTF